MFVFSLFLWPSPAVALVGAIVLPIAVQSGFNTACSSHGNEPVLVMVLPLAMMQ